MREWLFLAGAGALGTLGRYAVSGLAYRVAGPLFPYGTLAVNVAGSAALGFSMQLALGTDLLPPPVRLAVTVGFLGAFTTFSTFTYETIRYVEDGAFLLAATNVLANVALGLLAAAGGLLGARLLLGGP